MAILSSRAELTELGRSDEIYVVRDGNSRRIKGYRFAPYDYVIDGRTDAQAGTALLNAASALTDADTGGEIKVTAGAVNLGTSTLILPEGVIVSGAGAGQRGSYSTCRGTRLYWTGPTDADNCLRIYGHGAGIRDLMIDGPATLAGDVVLIDGSAFTGLTKPILNNIRISNGPASASYWGLVIRDAYHVSARDIVMDIDCNGILIDEDDEPFNVGNSHYSDVMVFQNTASTIGWKIEAPALTQRTNLITLTQCGALCLGTSGAGSTGLMLRGASKLNFVGLDIEEHATLVDIGVGGGSGAASHNVFTGSYLASNTYADKNIICDASSVANTFIGGYITRPAAQSSDLQYDLTKGGADPNYYYHVRKSTGGYYTEA
jgi:hypothetical protein